MAGMEGLGSRFNVIPIAAGQGFNISACSGVAFLCTGNDTFTLTLATSFASGYSQPSGWNPITHYYQSTNTSGTAVWTKVTQSASNAVVQSSDYVTVVTLLGTMVPDTYNYVKCTATNADGVLVALLHDLAVQRAPANLAKVSA